MTSPTTTFTFYNNIEVFTVAYIVYINAIVVWAIWRMAWIDQTWEFRLPAMCPVIPIRLTPLVHKDIIFIVMISCMKVNGCMFQLSPSIVYSVYHFRARVISSMAVPVSSSIAAWTFWVTIYYIGDLAMLITIIELLPVATSDNRIVMARYGTWFRCCLLYTSPSPRD